MASRIVPIKDFNQGGVADSIYSGNANSNARLVGWNIHEKPSLLQVNQKMTKDSGSTIDEFCKNKVRASNGIRYWFSATSGKVWQDKNGTYTLVYTTSPAAGAAGCLGAREYQGYIYWATQNRLHRIPVASADGAAAWTTNAVPNWKTFTTGDDTFHPMTEVNLVLYIGDGNLVAQVDAGVFSAAALDLATPHRVSALGKMSTDLLIGTFIAAGVNKASIFRWNTWSVSFTNEDEVPEEGINAFLEADNYVIIQAGLGGALYTYNGLVLEFLNRVVGDYSPTAQAKVYPEAVGMFRSSLPIFGVSNVTGNPCDQGVWSLGRHSRNYGLVLNLEFPVSTVDGDGYHYLNGVEIGAVMVDGANVYISWKLTVGVSVTYGVDKLDYSNKIVHPILETRLIAPDRTTLIPFDKFLAHYQAMPSGCSIVFKVKANHAGSWTTMTSIQDTDRLNYLVEANRLEAKSIQLRVEGVSSGNNSPNIEEIDVLLN